MKVAFALAFLILPTLALAGEPDPAKIARFHLAMEELRRNYDLARSVAEAPPISQSGAPDKDDLTPEPYIFPLSPRRLNEWWSDRTEEYFHSIEDRALGVPLRMKAPRTPGHLRVMEDDARFQSRISRRGWRVVIGVGQERTPFLIDEVRKYGIENETHEFGSVRASYTFGSFKRR